MSVFGFDDTYTFCQSFFLLELRNGVVAWTASSGSNLLTGPIACQLFEQRNRIIDLGDKFPRIFLFQCIFCAAGLLP